MPGMCLALDFKVPWFMFFSEMPVDEEFLFMYQESGLD